MYRSFVESTLRSVDTHAYHKHVLIINSHWRTVALQDDDDVLFIVTARYASYVALLYTFLQVVFVLRTLASKATGQTRTLQFNVHVNRLDSLFFSEPSSNLLTYLLTYLLYFTFCLKESDATTEVVIAMATDLECVK